MPNNNSFSPAAALPAHYRTERVEPAPASSVRAAPLSGASRSTYYATEGQPLEAVLSQLTQLEAELARR